MNTPSSKYLTKQSPVLKGLTYNELVYQALIGTALTMFLSGILGAVWGLGIYFFLGGLILGAVFSWVLFPRIFLKMKGDEPFELLLKKITIKASRYGFLKNPYIFYEGVWLKAKRFKE